MIDEALRTHIAANVASSLAEDIGVADYTARLIPADRLATGQVVTREDAVLCGQQWFEHAFTALDKNSTVRWLSNEGESIRAGQTICEIHANARALLSAERTALNFLQLLTGTATRTRYFVEAIAGTDAQIVDTRKTLPGLRQAQKYAVRVGGGTNHRHGLYDGILIKENHIIAAGGIKAAMEMARKISPTNVFIEIEVETLEELEAALTADAHMILLDNFSLEMMRKAVRINAGRAELEASGGVNINIVRSIAETGVQRISIGTLTKDVQSVDLSLRHSEQ